MNQDFIFELACLFCAAGICALCVGWAMTISRLARAEEKIARLLALAEVGS